MSTANAVEEFIRAFNEGDLDRFVAVLDPEVEIHGMRSTRRGVEEAREWATRAPGGVQQNIVLEQLVPGEKGAAPDGAAPSPERVVALIERHMYWDEDGSPAGTDLMAWLFELRDGRIRSWRPYEDRAAALAAARG